MKCHVRAVGTSLHYDRLFIRKVELLPNQNPQNVCVWLTQLLRAGCEGLLVLLRQEDQQLFFFFLLSLVWRLDEEETIKNWRIFFN